MIKIFIIDYSNNIDHKKYIEILQKKFNIVSNKTSQSIAGYIATITLLYNHLKSQYPDFLISNLQFGANSHGKPFLLNNHFIKYNLSHSYKKIVFALSNNNIGIDIEKISSPNLNIASRFFSDDEKNFILFDKSKLESIENFYKVWTLKESYIKYLGTGFSKNLKSFSFKINSNDIQIADADINPTCQFSLLKIEEYILAICGHGAFDISNISFNLIQNYWDNLI